MGPSGLRGGLATLWANLRYTWCQGASTASPASKDTSTCEGQQAARPGAGVSGNPCHPSIQPGYCCWRRPFSQIPELNNGYRKNSSASCGASSRGRRRARTSAWLLETRVLGHCCVALAAETPAPARRKSALDIREPRVQTSAVSLFCRVTLSSGAPLSEPQFPPPEKGSDEPAPSWLGEAQRRFPVCARSWPPRGCPGRVGGPPPARGAPWGPGLFSQPELRQPIVKGACRVEPAGRGGRSQPGKAAHGVQERQASGKKWKRQILLWWALPLSPVQRGQPPSQLPKPYLPPAANPTADT